MMQIESSRYYLGCVESRSYIKEFHQDPGLPELLRKQTLILLSNSTTHITYGTFGHISVSLRIPHSKKVDQTAVGTCWTVDGIPFLPGWITSECPGCWWTTLPPTVVGYCAYELG